MFPFHLKYSTGRNGCKSKSFLKSSTSWFDILTKRGAKKPFRISERFFILWIRNGEIRSSQFHFCLKCDHRMSPYSHLRWTAILDIDSDLNDSLSPDSLTLLRLKGKISENSIRP